MGPRTGVWSGPSTGPLSGGPLAAAWGVVTGSSTARGLAVWLVPGSGSWSA